VADSGDLQLYTVEQVATLCKVSAKTVYRAIWHGRLRASQLGVGAAYRMKLEDVQAWVDGSTVVQFRPKVTRRSRTKTASPQPKPSTTTSTDGRLFAPEDLNGGT
jgi:excisionase family DNA binding protein